MLACLSANAAYATKPCQAPDTSWFLEHVVKPSDTVVYARILDYSKGTDTSENNWTVIHVVKVLHGSDATPPALRINAWQADFYPLYTYKKGDYVVLWLKQDKQAYTITDLDWAYCVPSVWSAKSNETAYDIRSNQPVSLKEIELLIAATL